MMNLLKRHRLAKGLTLRELGQRIGVSTAAVSTWETGRCIPAAGTIPKLARALGLDPLTLTKVISPESSEPAHAA